jgi:hypothetical protein
MGLNERLGHKKANLVRLGLKAGAVLGIAGGTALGVKKGQTEFDEYKSKEQQKQREENVAVFAGIARDSKSRIGAQRVDQEGTEIIKRTRGGVFGGGLTAPPPPPPPTAKSLATRAVGVAVGQASLGDEIKRAGGAFFQASLEKEEREARFRAEQQARAQADTTTAMGGIGSTEAGVRDLARIGGRKLKKAVPNLNPLRFVR